MEHKVKDDKDIYKLGVDDILSGDSNIKLFVYTEEEYRDFSNGFDASSVKSMLDSVSMALKIQQPEQSTVDFLTNYINTLSSSELQRFDDMVKTFTDTDPNMLWDMLHLEDKEMYGTPTKFYEWLSTLSDDIIDMYIYKAADGRRLHPSSMYKNEPATTVEILDGYIAISSSNLQALNKFKDRVLMSNKCSYEHRIKTHDGIEIHSYVFNMNGNSTS
tara:strand:- start:145 stop:795 length:651 start_codon:yes stop_codon:yes gene_type:complete